MERAGHGGLLYNNWLSRLSEGLRRACVVGIGCALLSERKILLDNYRYWGDLGFCSRGYRSALERRTRYLHMMAAWRLILVNGF